jgi:hypothetical protein
MFLIFKPKVLHVDCFTNNLGAFELFPIDYSHKFIPEWWKKLPKNLTKNERGQDIFWPSSTMKSCSGFNSLFKKGITIPLWTDMAIKINQLNVDVKLSSEETALGSHSYSQMEGSYPVQKYALIKIMSPWLLNCKENISFNFIQNTWNFYNMDDIIIPPGIVDYKYQTITNINFFVNKEKNRNLLINAGQPMVNIIPLTDKKIKIHTHFISDSDFLKKSSRNSQTSFNNVLSKIKKITDNKEKSSCPFHF